MWYADDNFNDDEQLILKELEYDLFRCSPEFRAMWRDNFNDYFRGTLDRTFWHKREEEWLSAKKCNYRKIGFKDYEYAHMIEDMVEFTSHVPGGRVSAFSNDPEFEKKLKSAFAKTESRLLKLARSWADPLVDRSERLYEKTKNINCFRIFMNAPYVPSKIVFASVENYEGTNFESDLLWRTDKIGYSLSLACLRRCLESLECLNSNPQTRLGFNFKEYLTRGAHLENLLNDTLSKIVLAVLTKNRLAE